MKKRIMSLLALLLMISFLVSSIASCDLTPGGSTDGGTTDGAGNSGANGNEGGSGEGSGKPAVSAAAFVSLDINPSISLTVDEENKVVTVFGENEDGRVLLYNEELTGLDLEDAVDKILTLAKELGYIGEDNKVIGATASAGSDEAAAAILDKINTKVSLTAEKLGIALTTDAEGAFSTLRELEALKERYPDNASIQAMTVSKFNLVISATENGELSIEAAAEMDDTALINEIAKVHSTIESFVTDVYLLERAEAKRIYDNAVAYAQDGVYHSFYMKNMTTHLLTCYLGGVYQMYASSARGFGAVADVLRYVERMNNYELTDEQAAPFMEALGLEESERELICNSEGKITITSIEAYADKLFKNTPAGPALEEMKAAVNTSLAAADEVVLSAIKTECAKHIPEIRNIINSSKAYVSSLSTVPGLSAYVADYEKIVAELEAVLDGGNLSAEDLKATAYELSLKAEEVLGKIRADLSEEEWNTVEAERAKIAEDHKAAGEAFEKAMKDAETAAKARFEELKAEYEGKAAGDNNASAEG